MADFDAAYAPTWCGDQDVAGSGLASLGRQRYPGHTQHRESHRGRTGDFAFRPSHLRFTATGQVTPNVGPAIIELVAPALRLEVLQAETITQNPLPHVQAMCHHFRHFCWEGIRCIVFGPCSRSLSHAPAGDAIAALFQPVVAPNRCFSAPCRASSNFNRIRSRGSCVALILESS